MSIAHSDRFAIERLVRELYSARTRGDYAALCGLFGKDAQFQITGAGQSTPIDLTAVGSNEIRSLLALMIKAFRLTDQTILSLVIDESKTAVHWRAKVHSKITGTVVLTEMIDLIEVRDGQIVSYVEFFGPRRAST